MGDVSGKGARGGRGVVRLARRAVRGRRRGSDRRERDVQTDAGGAGDSRTKGAHVVRRVERGRGRTDERWDDDVRAANHANQGGDERRRQVRGRVLRGVRARERVRCGRLRDGGDEDRGRAEGTRHRAGVSRVRRHRRRRARGERQRRRQGYGEVLRKVSQRFAVENDHNGSIHRHRTGVLDHANDVRTGRTARGFGAPEPVHVHSRRRERVHRRDGELLARR
mmetsp:Transcript_3955/g.15289  ORF Transcript_3955/g.15289 Transcript_3955/m.15289 type:complete len:223 (-) Transcript_3955:6530-7198(-)